MVWPTFQRGRAVPLWVPVWVLLEMPAILKATSSTVATKSCARRGLTGLCTVEAICAGFKKKTFLPPEPDW